MLDLPVDEQVGGSMLCVPPTRRSEGHLDKLVRSARRICAERAGLVVGFGGLSDADLERALDTLDRALARHS